MSVVAFERRQGAAVWSEAELDFILTTLLAPVSGRTFETGVTENGHVQFYLLGPGPESVRAVSVPGRADVPSGRRIGPAAVRASQSRSRRLACKGGGLVLGASHGECDHAVVRDPQCIEEKLEPILVEGEELLVQVVPQRAAFA